MIPVFFQGGKRFCRFNVSKMAKLRNVAASSLTGMVIVSILVFIASFSLDFLVLIVP